MDEYIDNSRGCLAMLSFSSSHCVALSGSNPFTLLSAEYAQCNHRAISDHWVPPTLSPGHCCFFFGFLFWQFACFDIGPQSPSNVTFFKFYPNLLTLRWPNTLSPVWIQQVAKNCISTAHFCFSTMLCHL